LPTIPPAHHITDIFFGKILLGNPQWFPIGGRQRQLLTSAHVKLNRSSQYAGRFLRTVTRAGIILMLGTMFHASGTGNMVAGGVRLDCVVVTDMGFYQTYSLHD